MTADVADLRISDAEAQSTTRKRDAQEVGQFEVRFTSPESQWIDSLNRDYKTSAIADGVVWLAVTGGEASLKDVTGSTIPEAERTAVPGYQRRYVAASYVSTRGQLTALSAYCGVAWTGEGMPSAGAKRRTVEASQAIQHTLHQVNVALSGKDLEVRTGGALHLHELDAAWQAHPEEHIEEPPVVKCGVCKIRLHFSNEHWRDEDGDYEMSEVVACDLCKGRGERKVAGRMQRCTGCWGQKTIRRAHHEHGPAEVA